MKIFPFSITCGVLLITQAFPAISAPVISEVLYNGAGSDGASGTMFVELFGAQGESLDGYTLVGVNGSNGDVYSSISLTGSIGADGVYLIADTGTDGTTAIADANLVINFDFQNGPDSILLKQGETTIDALGYGEFSAGQFFAGESSSAPDTGDGLSLARVFADVDSNDNSQDFHVLQTPTPGLVNLSEVPAPAAAWLFGSGMLALAGYTRRRSMN